MPELKNALYHSKYDSSWDGNYNENQLIAMIPSTTDFSFQDVGGNNFLDMAIDSEMPKLTMALIATGKFDLGM